jgi:Tfp pilus assembly protein PilF
MLLLGVELAGQRNDEDARSSFVLALKNIYPESREYKSYLRDTERNQGAE